MMPERIQLRRRKGWRMPANTVKVDRSTKWGNPFVTGTDGTRAECVSLYKRLLAGYCCLTTPASMADQNSARGHVAEHLDELRGKNLACWCPLEAPCHADVLLEIANQADPDG